MPSKPVTHEDEVTALARVLELDIGYDIGMCGTGCLYLRSLEDGRFATGDHLVKDSEEIFDNPTLAIKRFIELRHQLQLGTDHEREAQKGTR